MSCRWLLMHCVRTAAARTFARVGSRSETSTPMMPMTTRSSISVKPRRQIRIRNAPDLLIIAAYHLLPRIHSFISPALDAPVRQSLSKEYHPLTMTILSEILDHNETFVRNAEYEAFRTDQFPSRRLV